MMRQVSLDREAFKEVSDAERAVGGGDMVGAGEGGGVPCVGSDGCLLPLGREKERDGVMRGKAGGTRTAADTLGGPSKLVLGVIPGADGLLDSTAAGAGSGADAGVGVVGGMLGLMA